LINEINKKQSKHIITIEDPVEFIYNEWKSLIEQREVWTNTLNFENWLKYSLRQAPDVILIWEMRDLETFRLALRAAETWNLVFATLHTSGAARTIARIIDMFPAWEKDQIRSQLSESLIAVVWQKLLKNENWKWRIPASEVLINTIWVSNVIRKWETHKIDSIIETSKWEWMIQMKDSLKKLYNDWLISEENYNLELSYLK
jgi:twitching motility protein PilT